MTSMARALDINDEKERWRLNDRKNQEENGLGSRTLGAEVGSEKA